MKTNTQMKKQHGFFDLGISLLILAVGGGSAIVASNTQTEVTESAKSEVVATAASTQTVMRDYDIDC